MFKIINLLRQNSGKIKYSLEFFPPKTPKGISNLNARVLKMHQNHSPLFLDLTWGAGGITSETTLSLASHWSNLEYKDSDYRDQQIIVNMHLTCTNMPREQIDQALIEAYSVGIKNIVALRGDAPLGAEGGWQEVEGGFKCGLDLVRYIREKYGDYFCLSVSGYPEGHPDQFIEITIDDLDDLSESETNRVCVYDGKFYVCPDEKYWEDLEYLKAKVEAGADLIITQLFFDSSLFLQFVKDCRKIGINCPILPGIMLIQNYGGFQKMTRFCKTHVPMKIKMALESIGDHKDKIQEFGIQIGKKMCRELYDGGVRHFHLYTLNQEPVAHEVLEFLKSLEKEN